MCTNSGAFGGLLGAVLGHIVELGWPRGPFSTERFSGMCRVATIFPPFGRFQQVLGLFRVTCRKSLCFLCPNPYPFPTGFSENTSVYAPGFRTIAAKMLRINPDPKKSARDIFCGRTRYRLGFIRVLPGKSLGIFPGRSENRLGFFWWPLGISLGISPGAAQDPPQGFLPTCLTQSVGVFRKVRSDPTH